MIRYSLVLIIFLALILYVLRLGKQGRISGRFRTVSLVLLGVLVLLVCTGLFYNIKYYSVQSVQEEFSENRGDILQRIEDLYDRGQYGRARKLAEEYQDVQDPALERLYRRSREAELLQRAEEIKGDSPEKLLTLWKKLAELTGRAEYREKARQQRRVLEERVERGLLSRIGELPEWSLAARALGYKELLQIDPRNITYQQRFDSLKRSVEQRIQDSPWNDICSASNIDPCAHFGYLVKGPGKGNGSKTEQPREILGVSRRPKGTLIDRQGTTSPEDGFYYILFDAESLSLKNIQFVEVEDPYEAFSLPKQGDIRDQP